MKKDIYHIAFVNLDHRTDRLNHMGKELARVGISANRIRGMYPQEYTGGENVEVMRKRTPGAIGIHFSQVRIMQESWAYNKHAWIMEDDIQFCNDFHLRFDYIENWMESHVWDVIWLGASFHVNPPYWHCVGGSKMPPNCSSELGYDAKRTEDPRMIRTFGAFATFAYIVNKDSIEKILNLFKKHIHESIGIDWLFIRLQPQLHCYSFVPGCVKQLDGVSDQFGVDDQRRGSTIWSGFLQLNGTKENSAYVYQDNMNDFNPDTFNFAEAR